ncbi:uncharacterized protein PHALS_03917 [Plasmopara halstedii]|uniref:Uncharacterized protein n=1 Tax=Plasmopara halstedii TaxID=4781 RepID=A0A0P1AYT7_PLAHL|nr:uncharacterized protein PHALS_03917 [Plasmopara halstedii]CEG47271.1 hypothetical protein PHALS_03917 [Plasmopara halstedii]|eukprot:XP_024583640.1 hypothetical protein PHALS_03917 [Plasmopara halstedii]
MQTSLDEWQPRSTGIVYQGMGIIAVKTYLDADWGSNTDDIRSVSGIMIMITSAPERTSLSACDALGMVSSKYKASKLEKTTKEQPL